MSYNRRNKYKNILIIQAKVLELQAQDEFMTLREIYDNHIYGVITHISYRTFHTYLGINAKKELKELEQTKVEDKDQLNLFK